MIMMSRMVVRLAKAPAGDAAAAPPAPATSSARGQQDNPRQRWRWTAHQTIKQPMIGRESARDHGLSRGSDRPKTPLSVA